MEHFAVRNEQLFCGLGLKLDMSGEMFKISKLWTIVAKKCSRNIYLDIFMEDMFAESVHESRNSGQNYIERCTYFKIVVNIANLMR